MLARTRVGMADLSPLSPMKRGRGLKVSGGNCSRPNDPQHNRVKVVQPIEVCEAQDENP